MKFPHNKKFALTIIDDTDGATVKNIRPVYEFLRSLGIKTTKTVWVYPSRDNFLGESLANYPYRQFIKKLQKQGFEIALHGVGSGKFSRQEIIEGLEIYRRFLSQYPKIQISHGQNPDNLYWGLKRFSWLKPFWFLNQKFQGENPQSFYFWGDFYQKHIRFSRNLTFCDINTLKVDPYMPYREKDKSYANYWFSSSDGANVGNFNRLTCPENIDRLRKEGGASIIYTHFASGFVREDYLDQTFQKNMSYLARQGGWFIPAGELLDYLLKIRKRPQPTKSELIRLEFKWLWDNFLKKVLF